MRRIWYVSTPGRTDGPYPTELSASTRAAAHVDRGVRARVFSADDSGRSEDTLACMECRRLAPFTCREHPPRERSPGRPVRLVGGSR